MEVREPNAKYLATPAYKQTEVGMIPEDWDVTHIAEVATTVSSGTSRANSDFGDFPVYGSTGIIGHCDRPQYAGRAILVARVGANAGKLALVDGAYGVTDNTIIVRLNDSCCLEYFWRQLDAKRLNSLAFGSGQPLVTGSQLKVLPIPLPAPAEQQAIAEALSDADALIESLEQLLTKKRQIKQGAMQELLTGQKRLLGFSEVWESRTIESFSAFVTKGATPTTYGFNWQDDGVLFLRSECVSADGLDLSQSMFISGAAHAALKRGEVRAGDLLMTITGNVGRVVCLPDGFGVANINQHIARIRISVADVSSEFVFHFLSQAEIRAKYSLITTGQAYPQISLKQVRETLLPIPCFQEQTAIATILSDMDAEIAALETKLTKARNLKQGMMQELLTGRIRLV